MSVTTGLPSELLGLREIQLPPDVTSTIVKVVPQNLVSVQSSAQSTVVGVNAAFTMPSTNVIFTLPAGNHHQYIDTSRSTLSFRAAFEVVSAGSAVVVTNANLRSHAFSFFNRLFTTSQSGQIIEDVANAALAEHQMLELTVDAASRDSLATMYGFGYQNQATNSLNDNGGHTIGQFANQTLAVGTTYNSYCIPLPSSLIGKYANGFFPIGKVSKMDVTMVTETALPLTLNVTSQTTAATIRVTLDLFSLNLHYLTLSPTAMSYLPKSPYHIMSGTTFRVASALIPAGTAGQTTTLIGIRGSSCRGIFTRFTDVTTAASGCMNSFYDSRLIPGLYNYHLNGTMRHPPNPVAVHLQPSLAFSYLQQAVDQTGNPMFKSSLVPNLYANAIASATALPAGSDSIVSSQNTSALHHSGFCFGMNTQKVSKPGILDGLNLNSANQFLELNIATPPTNNVVAYFIARLDVLYIISETGDIEVRV